MFVFRPKLFSRFVVSLYKGLVGFWPKLTIKATSSAINKFKRKVKGKWGVKQKKDSFSVLLIASMASSLKQPVGSSLTKLEKES